VPRSTDIVVVRIWLVTRALLLPAGGRFDHERVASSGAAIAVVGVVAD
jgi:hypothetical protein